MVETRVDHLKSPVVFLKRHLTSLNQGLALAEPVFEVDIQPKLDGIMEDLMKDFPIVQAWVSTLGNVNSKFKDKWFVGVNLGTYRGKELKSLNKERIKSVSQERQLVLNLGMLNTYAASRDPQWQDVQLRTPASV